MSQCNTLREIIKGLIVLSLIAVIGSIIWMTKDPHWFWGLILPGLIAIDFWA